MLTGTPKGSGQHYNAAATCKPAFTAPLTIVKSGMHAGQLAPEEPADYVRQVCTGRDPRNGRRAGSFLEELCNGCGTAPVASTRK